MTRPRREFSKRLRAQIVTRAMNANGQIVCEGCGLVLAAKRYEIDHTLPEALADKAKELTAEDGKLLGLDCCHKPKTADDIRRIRKSDRQRNRHRGISRSPNPIPGSRRTKWKRKIDGTTVRRDAP